MDNKKYLDKVLDYLVRSTKIDYDKKKVWFSFVPYPLIKVTHFGTFSPPDPTFPRSRFVPPPSFFENYCINQFGLSYDEIEYIWKEYREIIKEKIESGE